MIIEQLKITSRIYWREVMFELQLDMYQTVGLAAVVFWLGNFLN